MTVPNVFISYSHKDEVWKDRLLPHLGMLAKAGRLTIWEDRHIDAGATWYDEIKKAMEDAEVAVCLISADYLNSDFCVKEEIPYLLERRKSDGMVLLPILIRPCAWTAIDWLKAIQMLPGDGKAVARDYKDDWDTPFTLVAERILAIPEQPVLMRRVGVDVEPRWSSPEKVDVDRLPATGKELFGRQDELKLLDEAWESDKINVISLVAWGGVGKSTLINKWREQIAADNYRGARRVFAWSFYSQGTGDRVTSADIFIAEALKWFGDPDPTQGSPWDKGQRLADLVKQSKTLLLLDGMEPLQSYLDVERGKIKDPALVMLITELARENPGLCIITTREEVADLADFLTTTQQIDLELISAEAGRALLRVGGVQGTDAQLEQAARDFGLHALALNLLSAYIHEIPGHHISNASAIPELDVPLKEGKHPRRVMSAFAERFGESAEVDLLRILGLFSSPADKEEIAAVRAVPSIPNLTEHLQSMSDSEWLKLINKLRRLKLLAPESKHRSDTLDAHPLVREHFGKHLKQEYPAAWREGNNRLYEYYKASAKELPDTIQEMAPLYAAVMHGCQAGRHQEAASEVYWKRINRKDEAFNAKILGAIGSELAALSGFFDDTSWHKPVDGLSEYYKIWILAEAGYDLRALGRLAEAAQPMQASLETLLIQKNWEQSARAAGNLSELYLTLGDMTQALAYAEQGVGLADQSGDGFVREMNRTVLANVLLQEGNLSKSQVAFQEAEELQQKRQPEFSFLYSLRGFQYCDLLLSQGDYAEVERRVSQTVQYAEQGWYSLLSIAHDNLSLGRGQLLHAVQTSEVSPTGTMSETSEVLNYFDRAVDGLRQAGRQDYLPLGLLARAEFYRITRVLDKAQRDLDEAFSIATRSGTGLFLADCHLEYARLSLARGMNDDGRGEALLRPYKDDARAYLSTAKEMIAKMGYHRRDKEVEELEKLLAMSL